MKKIVSLVLTFCSLLFATADGPDFWRVTNVQSNDTLSVRNSFSHNSTKIGELQYNDDCIKVEKVQEMGNGRFWYFVNHNNIRGWVNGKFLTEGGQHCHD